MLETRWPEQLGRANISAAEINIVAPERRGVAFGPVHWILCLLEGLAVGSSCVCPTVSTAATRGSPVTESLLANVSL